MEPNVSTSTNAHTDTILALTNVKTSSPDTSVSVLKDWSLTAIKALAVSDDCGEKYSILDTLFSQSISVLCDLQKMIIC